VYLELFRTQDPVAAASPSKDGPTSPGVRHLAFKVDSVDAKLAEMGDAARLTLGPLSFNDFIAGWRSAWVADPEGNVIEISQGFQDDAGG
jgi:glyoxylase I family protein